MTKEDFLLEKKSLIIDYLKTNPIKGMTYLGVDPSLTASGIAIIRDGELTHFKEIKPNTFGSERFIYIREAMRKLIKYHSVDFIVHESPSLQSRNTSSLVDLGGLWIVLTVLYFEMKVPYFLASPSQTKKFLSGRGVGVQKNEMLLALYKRWGIETTSDNICDAISLAKLAQYTHAYVLDKPVKDMIAPQEEVILKVLDLKKKRKVKKRGTTKQVFEIKE